ncbi:PEP-dependent phosphotransferase enzyme II [Klebsiella michiganensis]|uniref:PEP-dependent phosphotransferase enzyme II n=1 Tax=Klebsiella michiganensis TaxID=1134687 RepID=A0A7H4PMH1_9ENTR|nr:PEP-dependent phosphotransferase enzyme II [Klebsiella michiganensis]
MLAIVLTLHPLNLFIEAQLGMIIPEAIMSLVKPLVAASDTLPAILLSVLVCQVLWFAGIHGALIVTRDYESVLDGEPVDQPGGNGPQAPRSRISMSRASGITIC